MMDDSEAIKNLFGNGKMVEKIFMGNIKPIKEESCVSFKNLIQTLSYSVYHAGSQHSKDSEYMEVPAKIFTKEKDDSVRILTKNGYEIIIELSVNRYPLIKINKVY